MEHALPLTQLMQKLQQHAGEHSLLPISVKYSMENEGKMPDFELLAQETNANFGNIVTQLLTNPDLAKSVRWDELSTEDQQMLRLHLAMLKTCAVSATGNERVFVREPCHRTLTSELLCPNLKGPAVTPRKKKKKTSNATASRQGGISTSKRDERSTSPDSRHKIPMSSPMLRMLAETRTPGSSPEDWRRRNEVANTTKPSLYMEEFASSGDDGQEYEYDSEDQLRKDVRRLVRQYVVDGDSSEYCSTSPSSAGTGSPNPRRGTSVGSESGIVREKKSSKSASRRNKSAAALAYPSRATQKKLLAGLAKYEQTLSGPMRKRGRIYKKRKLRKEKGFVGSESFQRLASGVRSLVNKKKKMLGGGRQDNMGGENSSSQSPHKLSPLRLTKHHNWNDLAAAHRDLLNQDNSRQHGGMLAATTSQHAQKEQTLEELNEEDSSSCSASAPPLPRAPAGSTMTASFTSGAASENPTGGQQQQTQQASFSSTAARIYADQVSDDPHRITQFDVQNWTKTGPIDQTPPSRGLYSANTPDDPLSVGKQVESANGGNSNPNNGTSSNGKYDPITEAARRRRTLQTPKTPYRQPWGVQPTALPPAAPGNDVITPSKEQSQKSYYLQNKEHSSSSAKKRMNKRNEPEYLKCSKTFAEGVIHHRRLIGTRENSASSASSTAGDFGFDESTRPPLPAGLSSSSKKLYYHAQSPTGKHTLDADLFAGLVNRVKGAMPGPLSDVEMGQQRGGGQQGNANEEDSATSQSNSLGRVRLDGWHRGLNNVDGESNGSKKGTSDIEVDDGNYLDDVNETMLSKVLDGGEEDEHDDRLGNAMDPDAMNNSSDISVVRGEARVSVDGRSPQNRTERAFVSDEEPGEAVEHDGTPLESHLVPQFSDTSEKDAESDTAVSGDSKKNIAAIQQRQKNLLLSPSEHDRPQGRRTTRRGQGQRSGRPIETEVTRFKQLNGTSTAGAAGGPQLLGSSSATSNVHPATSKRDAKAKTLGLGTTTNFYNRDTHFASMDSLAGASEDMTQAAIELLRTGNTDIMKVESVGSLSFAGGGNNATSAASSSKSKQMQPNLPPQVPTTTSTSSTQRLAQVDFSQAIMTRPKGSPAGSDRSSDHPAAPAHDSTNSNLPSNASGATTTSTVKPHVIAKPNYSTTHNKPVISRTNSKEDRAEAISSSFTSAQKQQQSEVEQLAGLVTNKDGTIDILSAMNKNLRKQLKEIGVKDSKEHQAAGGSTTLPSSPGGKLVKGQTSGLVGRKDHHFSSTSRFIQQQVVEATSLQATATSNRGFGSTLGGGGTSSPFKRSPGKLPRKKDQTAPRFL
ncbi:unnamed protein product [Amoebophrya sp. A120]|nr:unnamed protein product [Amoebophrya sp. A120]|eukprot:GSA120T00012996001.1